MRMRFNHMELTVATGTLDDVFGWTGVDTEVVGQLCHILLTGDGGDFILLAESDDPISSPGYDHLGLLQPTRVAVDELLGRCRRRQERDERIRIKEYKDLVTGDLVVHAFYVKHLLPIWFDVQCMERGGEPVAL